MRCSLAIFLLVQVQSIVAQEIITPLALKDKSIESFDAFPIGDSVLVTYRTGVRDEHPGSFHCMLIKPDKSVVDTKMPSTAFNNVISVTDSDTALNLYYINTIDKTVRLKKNWYDKRTGKAKSHDGTLSLSGGIVLGAFHTPDLIVLSKDNREDTLIVSQIRDLNLIREQRFFMPRDLLKQVSKMSVISESRRINPEQVVASLKFFLASDTLTVVRDSQKKYQEFNGYTEVTTFELKTGTRRTTIIGEATQKSFWSYYHDGFIFKIRKSKPVTMMVFKDGKEIYSLTFDQGLPFMNQQSFRRNIVDLTVVKKETVWDAISNNASLFITVHDDEQNKMFLKIGSHELAQTYVYVPGGGALAGALAGALTAAMVPQSGDPTQYTDRYFYMYGDPYTGFEFHAGEGFVDEAIDSYERNDLDPKPDKFKFKSYLRTKSYTYAFYRRKRADEMEIVRFKN
jgi:hypothetical protein